MSRSTFQQLSFIAKLAVLNCVLLFILLSGCVSLVKISYPPEAVIHPTFDQPYTIWRH